MSTHYYRYLLCCIPLLVTGCGDVNDPTIALPGISTTAISPTSISLSWNKATDGRTESSALVYKVYQSGPNPAYQSFDTISEVEAGTLVGTLTNADNITISSGIAAGNSYYFNVVVVDEEDNKSLYDPLGEHFHASLAYYYPFQGNRNDVASTNHLVVVAGMSAPGQTLDRFGHPSSAYNFNPDGTSQCLESTSNVGAPIGGADRSVSFWVQSANLTSSTTRAAFAWGNDSGNGTSFGAFEAGTAAPWTVWLGGTEDLSTGSNATTNWEHWVVGIDGSTVYTYKNGAVINNGIAVTVATVDTLLYVGCGIVSGIPGYPYKGIIDDVRVYSQMLSVTDVANLYAVTRP